MMKTLKRYSNNIEGWMTDVELSFLHTIASEYGSVVEVGSWKGRSTDALCAANHAKVSAVDHFQGSMNERASSHREAVDGDIFGQFLANVGKYENLTVYRMGSADAAKRFKDKSVDAVFIDAGHTYEEVKADIEVWLPKVRKMVCGHDYGWESVNKAVHEFFPKVETVNSIWIMKL